MNIGGLGMVTTVDGVRGEDGRRYLGGENLFTTEDEEMMIGE